MFRLLNWSKFLGVNRHFILSFEDEAQRTSYKWYYIPNIEIKDL